MASGMEGNWAGIGPRPVVTVPRATRIRRMPSGRTTCSRAAAAEHVGGEFRLAALVNGRQRRPQDPVVLQGEGVCLVAGELEHVSGCHPKNAFLTISAVFMGVSSMLGSLSVWKSLPLKGFGAPCDHWICLPSS